MPNVEIDAELAARAAEIAAERGETVEAVIERALRQYLTQPEQGSLA